MNDQRIAILTDTGTDVPADFVADHDVREVALMVNYPEGSYRSVLEISTDEIIRRFETEIPTTSLPSPDEIRAALEKAHADGYERAVFVTISSGLSATNSTVELVAREMPEFPTMVIDTKSIAIAAGMVVMEAVKLVECGVAYENLRDKLEALSRDTRVYFAAKDLSYLRHGGRINEATYRLGSMLNLKPVFFCDAEGKYATIKKARGWERALEAEFQLLKDYAQKFPKVMCAVSCTKAEDHTEEFMERIRNEVPNAVDVVSCGISPDLIVHAGPNLVGMAVQPALD